jgi:hypothetical protein
MKYSNIANRKTWKISQIYQTGFNKTKTVDQWLVTEYWCPACCRDSLNIDAFTSAWANFARRATNNNLAISPLSTIEYTKGQCMPWTLQLLLNAVWTPSVTEGLSGDVSQNNKISINTHNWEKKDLILSNYRVLSDISRSKFQGNRLLVYNILLRNIWS